MVLAEEQLDVWKSFNSKMFTEKYQQCYGSKSPNERGWQKNKSENWDVTSTFVLYIAFWMQSRYGDMVPGMYEA